MKKKMHTITYDAYRKISAFSDDYDWFGRTETVSEDRLRERIYEIDTYVCHRYLKVDGEFVFPGF